MLGPDSLSLLVTAQLAIIVRPERSILLKYASRDIIALLLVTSKMSAHRVLTNVIPKLDFAWIVIMGITVIPLRLKV